MGITLRKLCCGLHQMHVFALKGAKSCHPPPEADLRQNHCKILWFGLWRGSASGGGFCAFKGKNVHLVQATAQFSQSGAHMQARGPKWPLKSVNLPKYHILTILPKEFEAFWALQGALGPRGGQIGPPDGAHMQVKWPLVPSDFVFFPSKSAI